MSESFSKLTGDVEQVLRHLKYSPHTISAYRRFWNRLSEYMDAKSYTEFTETAAEQYFQATYGLPLLAPSGARSSDAGHCHRAIMVLLEFQKSGTIYRRRLGKSHKFNECFQPMIGDFMSFIEGSMARTSYRQVRSRMESFLGFLSSHSCTDFTKLNRQTILAYWKTRSHVCRTTQVYDAYVLRKFFDFLYQHGYTVVDNSVFVPNVQGNRKGQLPSFYTTEELSALLSAVDRESPIGKRDYAILLFAVRYGMRVGDIRNLRLSDINWNLSSFTFQQGKNGTEMTFQMMDDVAAALIDYFQNGRPETDCRNIFVRHNAPYEAFGADDNLHYIINKYMNFLGFADFHHRKRGLHSLRHSIAGNMLDMGVPMPVISEVLGHSSTDTTMIYAKIGTEQLRNCALEVD